METVTMVAALPVHEPHVNGKVDSIDNITLVDTQMDKHAPSNSYDSPSLSPISSSSQNGHTPHQDHDEQTTTIEIKVESHAATPPLPVESAVSPVSTSIPENIPPITLPLASTPTNPSHGEASDNNYSILPLNSNASPSDPPSPTTQSNTSPATSALSNTNLIVVEADPSLVPAIPLPSPKLSHDIPQTEAHSCSPAKLATFPLSSSPSNPFSYPPNSQSTTTTTTTASTTSTSSTLSDDAPASLDWWDSEFVHIRPQQIIVNNYYNNNNSAPVYHNLDNFLPIPKLDNYLPPTSPSSSTTTTTTTTSTANPFSDTFSTPANNSNSNSNNNNNNLNYNIGTFYNKITNNTTHTSYNNYNTNNSNNNNNSYQVYSADKNPFISPSPPLLPKPDKAICTITPLSSSNEYLVYEFEDDGFPTTSTTFTSRTTTSTSTSTTTTSTAHRYDDAAYFPIENRGHTMDVDPIEESVIDEIASMLSDFSRDKIRQAVRLTNNDMEKSLQLLLDGGLQDDEDFGQGIIQHSHQEPVPTNPQVVNEKPRKIEEIYHDEEEESDDEHFERKKPRSGLTESQEIMLMLQQEEALAEIQRKRDEELSMQLINSLQSEQNEIKQQEDQTIAQDQALIDELQAENDKVTEARKKEEQEYEKLLNDMLTEERAKLQAQLDAKTYNCQICFSDVKIEDMYTLDGCHHRFCFDCVDNYLSTQIKDGRTKDIKCPTVGCEHMITYEEVKQVVSAEVLDKYENFLLRAYLLTDANCRWCPRPGCNTAMIGSADNPMLVCPNQKCNFAFCFKCRDEWHHDATCEEYQKWKEMVESGNEEEPEEEPTPPPVTPPATRGRGGRGRGGAGRGGRGGISTTVPPPVTPLTARQLRELRSPTRRGNLLQMVQSYFRPEPAPEPTPPAEPEPDPSDPPADPPADPSPTSSPNPKPKVTVAQKMLEKPEGVSFREWIVSQMSETQSSRKVKAWMQKNTKQCPQCHAAIEKNGGCNHMTCASCRHQFCWLCMGVYSSTHFSTGTCKQFT